MVVVGFLIYTLNLPANTPAIADTSAIDGQQMSTSTDNSQMTATDTTTLQTNTSTTTKVTNTKMKDSYTIKMETNKGTIILALNPKIAPNTVANFVKLANEGFYNGTKFHRVIPGFMIQGGDRFSKDDNNKDAWGTGNPGYKFADEITDPATYQNGYKRGILAMANSGPDTNGSQFFIMHQNYGLPPNYTIFGKILDGDATSLKTLDAIAAVKTVDPANHNDRPVSDVVITKVTVQ